MDYSAYPLKLLKDLEQLHQEVREFVDKRSDNIRLTREDPLSIEIIANKGNHCFFIISDPHLSPTAKDSEAKITYYPKSELENITSSLNVTFEQCVKVLHKWEERVIKYSAIAITREEKLLKQFEDEYYEDLKIIEPDADTAAFDLPRQLLLYSYYELAEKVIEKEMEKGEPIQHLKEEATELKNNVQNVTKNQALKGLSKFLAKVQKAGLKFLNPVWTDGKKEVIKRGINYVLDHVPDMASYIQNNLLNHL